MPLMTTVEKNSVKVFLVIKIRQGTKRQIVTFIPLEEGSGFFGGKSIKNKMLAVFLSPIEITQRNIIKVYSQGRSTFKINFERGLRGRGWRSWDKGVEVLG